MEINNSELQAILDKVTELRHELHKLPEASMKEYKTKQAIMDFMMAYLPGWIGYMVYVLFILAVVITGIVLFIVFRKRFALDPGQIPKGQRFKTVICNPGMLCYCIFWIVMILLQMFPEIVQMLLGISPLSL